ncbi:hypothetical protein P3W45_001337 [Vairimorpha bombi]|jgi:dTMP kinase
MFVVFEGLDKSGKSTLSRSVHTKLNKMNVSAKEIHFPDRSSVIGDILDKYLTGKMNIDPESTHLLFTADRYNKKKYIEETSKDNVLLCDRYSWSGIACSSAKGLDMAWCIDTERLLPQPDLTILLVADIDITMKRSNWGDEVLETRDFQMKMAEGYSHMHEFVDNVVKLDATKSVEELTDLVLEEIEKFFRGRCVQIQN